MEIKVLGKGIEVTEAINDYIEKKLDRIDRYFENSIGEVTIRTEKNLQIAHKIALCNTIGVFFSQSLSVYFKSNFAGKQKSSWHVERVYSFQIAGFTFTSNFGP